MESGCVSLVGLLLVGSHKMLTLPVLPLYIDVRVGARKPLLSSGNLTLLLLVVMDSDALRVIPCIRQQSDMSPNY